MAKCFQWLAIGGVLGVTASLVGVRGDETPPPAAQSNVAPVEPAPASEAWRQDPVCQMVFFAVLEGLYTDGVQDEVVDLIVPPKTDLDTNVKHCFVFRCPMCHAAYEAFVLYQRRQSFQGASDEKSTFGQGVEPAIIKDLKSDKPMERVFALGRLIRPWLDKRIRSQNISKAEREQMIQQILEYAKRGNSLFLAYRSDSKSVYHDWQFYGGCQACAAAQAIARDMQHEQRNIERPTQ